jgi:serine/threonine protein kinase/WD40 repeat protein
MGRLSGIDHVDRVTPSIDEIYFSALEKPTSGERCAYLDQACAGDQELRRRVERLLSAESKVGNFLESPAPEIAAAFGSSLAECPGTVIGPYTLLEQIGEGGFGIVYIADQEAPVRRQVALKIVRPGMDTRQVLARFKAELEALSLMDHPNIARVLDAGATNAGRPYFVMELVRGVPITDYCDQNHLSVHARLDLFVQVCHAVQHAHQKGIIHRDIKPSNVLVAQRDGRPVPKVIDFGVAKAIERQRTPETHFTRMAEMIGTPLYMSPEQAEMTSLDIDTRSDIYSLGVLLYELLTGSTPFDPERLHDAAFDEIRRIIREEDPPKPSTRIGALGKTLTVVAARRHADPDRLSQLVRGDLDWIVMKSLEKDRSRRYETANSLALDVQRYLADEPVQASPPSAGYRLRKFVRRNKGMVLAASAVLLALVAGIIGTTWGMLRATEAEADAVQAANQKQIALAIAQESERKKSEQLWESLVAQARAHRLSRRPGQRFESLETLKEATRLARTLNFSPAKFQELRSAAIATLAVPDLYLTGPWSSWPSDALALDFDGAHSLYARTDRAGNCSIRRVSDDVEVCRMPGLGLPASPVLSRDGKFVAVCDLTPKLNFGKGVHLWQIGTPPRQLLYEVNGSTVDFRESQQCALAFNDGSINLYELPSGRQLSHLAPETMTRGINIALHPTEPLVAVSSYVADVLQLRDAKTGKIVAACDHQDGALTSAWLPGGRALAVAYGNCQIRLYDRATLRAYRTLETEVAATSIEFNHSGDQMALRGWSNAVGLFNCRTGQNLMRVLAPVSACRYSSDQSSLAGAVHEGKVGIWRVASDQEFRAVESINSPDDNKDRLERCDTDGRLLACATVDGFSLWDVATGSALGSVPAGKTNAVLFEPSGALLTLSDEGLQRWPISKGFEGTGKLSIGPPKQLTSAPGGRIAQSRDGRVIVTSCRSVAAGIPYAGVWVLHAEHPNEPIRIDPGADATDIAISSDGRWIVATTHYVGMAKLWDARDGRLVKQLASWGAICPCFSPDGRWLSIGVEEGRLLATQTWEPGPSLGARAVFSPDSKLAAVPASTGLRLLEIPTGREIALLEAPTLDPIDRSLFTPDGTKLVAMTFGKVPHIWDLRRIREELKELDLDWEWPEFPPAAAPPPIAGPVRVEIHGLPGAAADSPSKPRNKADDKPRTLPGS